MAALAVTLVLACQEDGSLDFRGPSPIYHENPAWSAHGWIAFHDTGIVRFDERGGREIDASLRGIWVIDPETRAESLVAMGADLPAWSRDGERLAFVLGCQIFIADRDGPDSRQLTFLGCNLFPTWSPDGAWIAYESNLMSVNRRFVIWTMRSDGSEKTNISRDASVEWRHPGWSPDGERIVHVRSVPDVHSDEIFTMDGSGQNAVRLTHNDVEDAAPTFSPDGSRIAFVSQLRIVVMHADGSAPVVVVDEPAMDPAWSPDGRRIVFTKIGSGAATGDGLLWIVDLETGEEFQLTHRRGPER